MPETMTNTRKIAHIAILSTLSFLLMYLQFPLIPSARCFCSSASYSLEPKTKLEKLHTGISRGNAWLNCGNVYAELCLRCATLCQICEF